MGKKKIKLTKEEIKYMQAAIQSDKDKDRAKDKDAAKKRAYRAPDKVRAETAEDYKQHHKPDEHK